jgi:O-antigen ligase
MLSYLASLFIDFPFLSQIDKSSYAGRILILSFLFLIPVFYDMFICLLKRIGQEKKIIRIILSLFLLSLLLSSLYINYPRKDNYFNSRSFSVSENDFKHDGTLYCHDRFHPSDRGYKLWADLIYGNFK